MGRPKHRRSWNRNQRRRWPIRRLRDQHCNHPRDMRTDKNCKTPRCPCGHWSRRDGLEGYRYRCYRSDCEHVAGYWWCWEVSTWTFGFTEELVSTVQGSRGEGGEWDRVGWWVEESEVCLSMCCCLISIWLYGMCWLVVSRFALDLISHCYETWESQKRPGIGYWMTLLRIGMKAYNYTCGDETGHTYNARQL